MNNDLVETEVKIATDRIQRKLLPSGPGKRLHAARMASSIPLESVALALHLTTQMVADLEDDNYTRFAGHTFIRGYLRNYARLLKLSPEEIIAVFNNLEIAEHESDKPKLSLKTTYQKPPVSIKKLLAWLVLVLVLLLSIPVANYLLKSTKFTFWPKTTKVAEQEKPKDRKIALAPKQDTDNVPLILPTVPTDVSLKPDEQQQAKLSPELIGKL
jgi:cytoskeletal protein RodZ